MSLAHGCCFDVVVVVKDVVLVVVVYCLASIYLMRSTTLQE
jgi:hypothetical protein